LEKLRSNETLRIWFNCLPEGRMLHSLDFCFRLLRPRPSFCKEKALMSVQANDRDWRNFPFGEGASNDYILSNDQRNGEGLDGIFGIDG
jgi:hypothetical protein